MNIFTRIFKVKSKVTVYFDKNGNVIGSVGNIGWTRAGRAAFHLHRRLPGPTFGMKLRRLFRCIGATINLMIEDALAIATAPEPRHAVREKAASPRLIEEHSGR